MFDKVKGKLGLVYEKEYKKLLIIPFFLIVLSLLVIGMNYSNTGELFKKDVSLKGGVTITIPGKTTSVGELENFLSANFQKSDVTVRAINQAGRQNGLIIDAGVEDDADVAELIALIEQKVGRLSKEEYSVRVIGSALGESFFREAMMAIVIAFALMAVVVLIYFRNFVPSLFVIWAVFADILCTFATLVFLGESFSSASIASLLLLIGFSVDTDILLTARVLKGHEGTVYERTIGAMKTGLTVAAAALAAVLAGLLTTQSETIRQIMLVLIIGLIFDVVHTWITNAGVLRWYLEPKKVKE